MKKMILYYIFMLLLSCCQGQIKNDIDMHKIEAVEKNKVSTNYFKSISIFDLKPLNKIDPDKYKSPYPMIEIPSDSSNTFIAHISLNKRDTILVSENDWCKYWVTNHDDMEGSFIKVNIIRNNVREVFLFKKMSESNLILTEYSEELKKANEIRYKKYFFEKRVQGISNFRNLKEETYNIIKDIVVKSKDILIARDYVYKFNGNSCNLHRVHYYPTDDEIILNKNDHLTLNINDYFWLDYLLLIPERY